MCILRRILRWLQLPHKTALRCGSALLAIALFALPYPALAVTAAASITLSKQAWAFNPTDSTQQYLPSSASVVTGTMITNSTGSGSIALLAPANITGAGGGLLKISYFSMTCSGPSHAGETMVATKAQLVASSSVTCATYAGGFDSTTLSGGQVHFNMMIFLDDRTLDDDTFPATNFTVVASAT